MKTDHPPLPPLLPGYSEAPERICGTPSAVEKTLRTAVADRFFAVSSMVIAMGRKFPA